MIENPGIEESSFLNSENARTSLGKMGKRLVHCLRMEIYLTYHARQFKAPILKNHTREKHSNITGTELKTSRGTNPSKRADNLSKNKVEKLKRYGPSARTHSMFVHPPIPCILQLA